MLPPFAELAASPQPRLDFLALSMAREFREVDEGTALATLELLGAEIVHASSGVGRSPQALTEVCTRTLGGAYGFAGDAREYDHPDNSMLDLVLERRRGLPILLSVVYVEAAHRGAIELDGVGLPGHFVVGHFGAEPPLLLDPFNRGVPIETDAPSEFVRPWRPQEIVMRMLNNLVASFMRRGDLGSAIKAATMRTLLPAPQEERELVQAELQALRASLN